MSVDRWIGVLAVCGMMVVLFLVAWIIGAPRTDTDTFNTDEGILFVRCEQHEWFEEATCSTATILPND